MGKHIEKDMDMIMDHEALGSLFELCSDAIVGVKDNRICFANPAAGTHFGLFAGADAASAFPSELLDNVSRGAVTLCVNDYPATVTVRQTDGLALLCLQPAEAADGDEADHLSQWPSLRCLSDSLMTMHIALDALFKRIPPEDDPSIAEYASILYRSYYRLRRLHSHISIAKSLRENTLLCTPTLIDLDRTLYELADSVSALAAPLAVEIRYSGTGRNFITMADRDYIELMILNLLSNSLLHCKRGGRIRIGLRQSGTGFIVSVDDDGSGMTDSALLHAFSGDEPLELSNSLAGIGCGLMIASGIAQQHGGSLMIDSMPDQGCRVRIFLPRKKPDKTELHNPDPIYEVRDMNQLLTELSVVLPTDCYQEKYLD